MVFHWSLNDSKSPQVSRTLLCILAVFKNAVVWVVSNCPPSSKSSRPFNNSLVTVPKAQIIFGNIVTLIFHSFFNSLARSKYYYYYYYLRVFHVRVSWWSFTGVWVTTSLLKSPGLFSGFSRFQSVVRMVSTRPPTSKSSSPFSNPLVTVPNAPITIVIIVTSMFHSFFQFSSKFEVLILLFTFFQFYSVVSRESKVDNFVSSLFFVYYYKVWSSGWN